MSTKRIYDRDTPEITHTGVEYNVQDDIIRLKELVSSAEEILTGKENNLLAFMRCAIAIGGSHELRRTLNRHSFIDARFSDGIKGKCEALEAKLHSLARSGIFVAEEGVRRGKSR